MFWGMVSRLQQSQATKTSTNHYGMTERGVTAPSSEPPPQQELNHQRRRQSHHRLCLYPRAYTPRAYIPRASRQSTIVAIANRFVQRGHRNRSEERRSRYPARKWGRGPQRPKQIYKMIVDSDLARFRRERGLVTALKDVLNRKSSQPTQHTKHLLAAFAASHPHIQSCTKSCSSP